MRIPVLRMVLAGVALGALCLVRAPMPAAEPPPPLTWEEALRLNVDEDGLTAAQVADLGFHDVCDRLEINPNKPVPEKFFYWKVSRKVSVNMAREVAEAKRAALIAETTERLKTLPGMDDVVVAYEDGRLVITGGAIREAKE